MIRTLLLLALTGALVSCNKPQSPAGKAHDEDKNFTHVQGDDAAMNAAIEKAKQTSGEFLEAVRHPKPSYSGFSVKKPYPAVPSSVEHMWISQVREVGDHLEGVVANEAYETKAVKLGDEVSFKLEEISDWKFLDGNRLRGGFTIRYFYDRMSPAEKNAFQRESGFVIN
jgi:uncharacterized protein YegJ (DUF2314 family)